MIEKLKDTVKIEKGKKAISENAGILGLVGELRRNDLIEYFNKSLPQRRSNRSYKPSVYAVSYLFTRLSGGYNLEDTRKISSDKEIHKLLEIKGMPKPNTLGNWFRDASEQHSMNVRVKNIGLCNKIIKKNQRSELTVDIDSKVHRSDNREAKMTYKEYKGYNPLYILLPEEKLVYDGEFRQGNVDPGKGNAEAIKRVIKKVPDCVETMRFRLDAAGWQTEVVKTVRKHNRKKDKDCEIFVRPGNYGRKVEGKGPLEREIEAIPEEKWKSYGEYKEEPTDWEIAEGVKTIGEGKQMEVLRMVVVRKPKGEGLFGTEYKYRAVVTNNETFSPQEVYEFYNQRGSAEDLIGEIVEDGLCDRFPMKADNANSLWLALSVMLYTVVQMMKLRNLPEKWYRLTIKTIRHRLMNVAVKVVRTGRYVKLKINKTHPWIEELKEFMKGSWSHWNKLVPA